MRVVVWNTACLEPGIEAVSKEIATLATHFDARVFGVSPHYRLRFADGGRTLGFHPGFDPLLRGLIPALEYFTDLNHVYGEPSPWVFHKTLKKKPMVLTVASEKGDLIAGFLARCRRIVVQTEGFKNRLLEFGVKEDRVELIYPGVDLVRFAPAAVPPPMETPRLLFATAPRAAEEMGPRGVSLLLKMARNHVDIHLRLLYRRWASGYTSLAATERFLREHPAPNVTLTDGVEADMAAVYPNYHFTVIPYVVPDGGKECPNSLVEGLACGVPVLISSAAPFAEFVARHQCGVVFEPHHDALAEAVAEAMPRWQVLSQNARAVALEHFSEAQVLQRYQRIYENALGGVF